MKSRSELLDDAVELLDRTGGRGRVRVVGDSMLPTIRAGGDLAIDFAPGRLRRGDLLLFRQRDYLTVHRLLGRARAPDGSPCLRTRGDSGRRLDPPLDPTRVVGRVIAIRRRDGWRGTRSFRARAYGALLALHELSWAGAAVLAERAERGLRRGAPRSRLRPLVEAIDRGLVRAVHALLFGLCHPRIPTPPGIAPAAEGGPGGPGPRSAGS